MADNPSIFSVDHIFKKPGLYKIWSEVEKDGTNYSFGHPEVNIDGVGLREDKKVLFSSNVIAGPGFAEGSGEASSYRVSMETSDTAVKGREVYLYFDIHTLTGMEVKVEQYLGANMHLSLIKDDRSQFIHTHSEEDSHSSSGMVPIAFAHSENESAGTIDKHQTSSSGDEVISFYVIFPEAGLYKAFAQFRPQGIDLPTDEALLAEFWIQVEEKALLPVSQWWGLLIISVVLIAGLSWGVSKYLKVRAEDVKVNAK